MNKKMLLQVICPVALLAVAVTPVSAACVNPPLTPEALSGFRSSPGALVTPDSDARAIEATTRDLAGTDASLAADLVKLAHGASPRFRTAIAAGLAQAATACSGVDPEAAQTIQETVAGFQDGQFQASFAAVAGDLSTAATEAANTSAAGSVGSVVVTTPNVGGVNANNGGGGGAAVTGLTISATGFTTNGTTTITAAASVSPTQ